MGTVWSSTVSALVTRSARRDPARPALSFGDRTWTYAELDRAVSRVARQLLALHFHKGDRIAAYGKNSDAYLILYLACARAGMVHVPVNFALTGEELAYIVNQSGSRAVFSDPALEGKVHAIRARLGAAHYGTLRGGAGNDVLAWALEGPADDPGVEVRDDDLAQLLYTSGTTAAPRGAMLTHRALVHEYASCIAALDLSAADRPLHVLPLYHSAQMHVFLMPYLAVGAANRLHEGPDPAAVLAEVEARGITSFFAPPTFWIALLNHPDFARRQLGSLTKGYYGASIMPVPVLKQLQARLAGLGFYNCFGQSEIAPLATVLRPEEHAERPDSAGRAVLFVDLRVVDDALRDVAAGEVGEVVYRSPQLCQGYWEKPEETEEAFQGGWFHSGDLARIDAGGFITIVDRKKDVINTGGVVVASREVEDQLYTHPAVKEVAVIATPHPRWIEAVTAVVVLKPGAQASAEELVAHAHGRLAPFKVPKVVHFVDDLPRNASGKILKRELRRRFEAQG